MDRSDFSGVVGAAHDLQWASEGPNINASGHFHDDMNRRYFSNLLGAFQSAKEVERAAADTGLYPDRVEIEGS